MDILQKQTGLLKLDPQASAILNDVCNTLENFSNLASIHTDELRAYAFGSVLSGTVSWCDVDVLVVIPAPELADQVRSALSKILVSVPLHLTIVLPVEFKELGHDAWGSLLPLPIGSWH